MRTFSLSCAYSALVDLKRVSASGAGELRQAEARILAAQAADDLTHVVVAVGETARDHRGVADAAGQRFHVLLQAQPGQLEAFEMTRHAVDAGRAERARDVAEALQQLRHQRAHFGRGLVHAFDRFAAS